jgi:hypothetical protein
MQRKKSQDGGGGGGGVVRSFVGSRSAVWVWSSGRRSAWIVPGRCPDREKGEKKEQLESSYSVGPM